MKRPNPLDRPQVERASKRFKIFEPAAMTWGVQRRRIHLLDLSLTGALAYCDDAPGADERVSIDCGPLTRQGRISWVLDGRFGIRFDEPIDQALLALLVKPA